MHAAQFGICCSCCPCNATEIIGHYSGPEKLDEKDIILTEKKVNFSMGAANPMDKVSPTITQCTCVPPHTMLKRFVRQLAAFGILLFTFLSLVFGGRRCTFSRTSTAATSSG